MKRANVSFLPLFVLFGPSVDWMVSTHTGKGKPALLSPLIHMFSSSKTPSQAHREIMFHRATLWPSHISRHRDQPVCTLELTTAWPTFAGLVLSAWSIFLSHHPPRCLTLPALCLLALWDPLSLPAISEAASISGCVHLPFLPPPATL